MPCLLESSTALLSLSLPTLVTPPSSSPQSSSSDEEEHVLQEEQDDDEEESEEDEEQENESLSPVKLLVFNPSADIGLTGPYSTVFTGK